MHIHRGQFNLHTVFRIHIEEISILVERRKKPNHKKPELSLIMIMLFSVRIKWFREQSNPPWLKLSTGSPDCATLQSIRHVLTQNYHIAKKSSLPSLQPHYKVHKCIKLKFWHTSVVHPVSLFLLKEYHVSKFAGWLVWGVF